VTSSWWSCHRCTWWVAPARPRIRSRCSRDEGCCASCAPPHRGPLPLRERGDREAPSPSLREKVGVRVRPYAHS
jgi:hypothetical protein